MTTFTQNLKQFLNSLDYSDIEPSFFTGEFSLEVGEWGDGSDKEPVVRAGLLELGVTNFENVQSVGGGEGDGETRFEVYSFTDGKEVLFVKFNGYYQSYGGSIYTDWSFVSPKEKVITVYEYTSYE